MTQHMQLQQQVPQLPTEAFQIAAAHQLGTPTTMYRFKFNSMLLFWFWGAFLVLSGIFAAIFLGLLLDFWVMGLPVGLFFVLMALWMMSVPYLYHNLRIYVCTDGFVRLKGSKVAVYRWDQIKEVRQKMSYQSSNMYASDNISRRYIIVRNDGATITFRDQVGNIKELGETIQREVTLYKLPQTIAAYNDGNSIDFGELVVTREGIVSDKQKVTFPWKHIKGIEISISSVVIAMEERGKVVNSAFKAAKIANVYLLQQLADYIVNGNISVNAGQVTPLNRQNQSVDGHVLPIDSMPPTTTENPTSFSTETGQYSVVQVQTRRHISVISGIMYFVSIGVLALSLLGVLVTLDDILFHKGTLSGFLGLLILLLVLCFLIGSIVVFIRRVRYRITRSRWWNQRVPRVIMLSFFLLSLLYSKLPSYMTSGQAGSLSIGGILAILGIIIMVAALY